MAIDCILDSGYSLGCRTGKGGVKTVYLGTFSGTTSYSVDPDGIVTGATGYNQFFEFEAPSETLSAMDTGIYSKDAYHQLYSQTVSAKIFATTQTERDLLYLLGSYRMFAIAEDNNGNYFLYGRNNGLWATEGEINLGTTFEDANLITFSVAGKESYPAVQVNSTLIATLIA